MPLRVIETITAAALWVCLPSFLPWGVFHRAVERRLAYGTHHEPDPAPGRGRDPLKKEGGEGPGAFRGENSPLHPRAAIHRRPEKGKRPLCDDGGRGRLQRGAGGGQGQEQASLPAPGAEALCVSHRDPHVSAPACGGGERSGGSAGGAVSGESGASAWVKDVEAFWQGGDLDPESNVQFGEGGAGTFSDGKLTTGTHDPRLTHVMETFVAAGAPEDILWQHKPHVGTDLLRQVVTNLRKEIQALGGAVRFGHRLSGLTLAGKQLTEIQVDQGRVTYTMPCDTLVLAPGHSARDTFRMLRQAGAAMEQKPFAIGVRIEHEQARISRAQFGESWEKLPPADYKLVCHLPNGRSAYTFCVCPGGQIVAAASQPGGVVTNGMSNRARDGKFINGGFLVGVGPGDFGSDDPLAGVAFQELWEAKAYAFGRPGYEAPAQRVGDLLRGVPTPNSLTHRSTYQPNVIFGDLRETLPNYVTDTLAQALPALDKKLHGFAAPDALLVGVETRSSSPVRILRGKDFQSDLRGLYPCGEGAGYAGGIVSAAVDGVRVAEAVAHPPVWTE